MSSWCTSIHPQCGRVPEAYDAGLLQHSGMSMEVKHGSMAMPQTSQRSPQFLPSGSLSVLRSSRAGALLGPFEVQPAFPPMVKPVSRPIWQSPSKKNIENESKQYMKDRMAFERRAAIYRAHADEQCHHHKPALSGKQCWPYEGGILKRHVGAAETAADVVVFDPILSEAKVVSSPGRPSSAPPMRNRGGSYTAAAAARAEYELQRQQLLLHGADQQRRPSTAGTAAAAGGRGRGWAVQAQGRYDPVCHQWLSPPDPDLERQHKRDWERRQGIIGIRCCPAGQAAVPSPERQAADQARLHTDHGEAAAVAATAVAVARGEGRGEGFGGRPGTAGSGVATTGIVCSPQRNPITGEGMPQDARKLASGQERVSAGASWGTYDVFQKEYKVAPKDPKYVKQEELCERSAFISGKGLRRVPLPPSQGVYDPIKGQWTVAPKDSRAMKGLDFAPRTLFSRDGTSSSGGAGSPYSGGGSVRASGSLYGGMRSSGGHVF